MLRLMVAVWIAIIPPARSVRIAVVGAGVGGGSSVHFLRAALGPDVELVVFEKGAYGLYGSIKPPALP